MQGLTGVIGGSDSMDFFSGGGSLTPASTARAFFFFGEAIKSKIDAHFDELFPHFNAGQLEEEGTVSERRAEIARNRLRVDVIDEEISALQGQLSELGTAGRPE
jgi:hypothetical protein